MEFCKRSDRIWLEDETGRELAYVAFPARDEHTVTIASTVVDDALRGQGVAGALLNSLAQELRASGRKAVPVCSYAVRWFQRHPEQADLLAQTDR